MAQIRHTAQARRDLLDLWLDIATDNPAAADRVYDRLEARMTVLTRFPEIGPQRPEIVPDARVLVESPYLILYRVLPRRGADRARAARGAAYRQRPLRGGACMTQLAPIAVPEDLTVQPTQLVEHMYPTAEAMTMNDEPSTDERAALNMAIWRLHQAGCWIDRITGLAFWQDRQTALSQSLTILILEDAELVMTMTASRGTGSIATTTVS